MPRAADVPCVPPALGPAYRQRVQKRVERHKDRSRTPSAGAERGARGATVEGPDKELEKGRLDDFQFSSDPITFQGWLLFTSPPCSLPIGLGACSSPSCPDPTPPSSSSRPSRPGTPSPISEPHGVVRGNPIFLRSSGAFLTNAGRESEVASHPSPRPRPTAPRVGGRYGRYGRRCPRSCLTTPTLSHCSPGIGSLRSGRLPHESLLFFAIHSRLQYIMPKAGKKKVASKAAPVKASKPGIFSAKNRSFGIGESQLRPPR